MRALALAAALLALPVGAQSLTVVATSPAMNATSVARTSPVTITFSGALDAATVTPARVRVFGRWSGPVPGTVDVSGPALTFTPSRPYQAGEHVTVQLGAAITAADGESIGARGMTFWAAAGPGTLDQTSRGTVAVRRAGEGNVVTYGGIGIDVDGDRFNDFVVSNEATGDVRVFRNDGTGRYSNFTVVPLPGGAVPSPLESGDFNGDGHLDVAVANVGGDRVSVVLGDGAGGFPTGASYVAGQNVRGIAVLDADGDGHDDLISGHRVGRTVGLHSGNADGTFEPVSLVPVTGVSPYSLAVADFDEDGRLDVAMASFDEQAVVILRSDGAGGFAESGRLAASGRPWMVAAGDVDRDGHADVVATGSNTSRANIFWGDGAGGFSGVSVLPAGSLVIAIDLGDLDGDGDLDVISSNYSSREWVLTETLPGRAYGAVRRIPATAAASCMTLHDRDDDGDLDMTGIDERDDLIFLFENTGAVSTTPPPATPALRLDLAGPHPARDVASVDVTLGGEADGRLRVTDPLGRLVADLGLVVDGRLDLDVSGYAPGVYVLRLDAGGATQTLLLTIAR